MRHMKIELLNLVEAKRIAGDVQWLRGELGIQMDGLLDAVMIPLRRWLLQQTGYATVEAFSLAAPLKARVQVFAWLIGVLVRKDYELFHVFAKPDVEHAEMLAKLTEIVNNPSLAAKIEINIITTK